MLWAILLMCLPTVALAQEILPEFVRLNVTEQAKCNSGPGLIEYVGDCCHFVLCEEPRGTSERGWKFPCAVGTVWNPEKCACVLFELYPACDYDSCPVLPVYTPGVCPQDLNKEEECCLVGTGQVYTAINATHYYLGDEDLIQKCPDGQVFLVDDCCCEGDIATGNEIYCHDFTFDFDPPSLRDSINQQDFAEENLAVFVFVPVESPIGMIPFGQGYALEFQFGASMTVPVYNGAWYGDQFTTAFSIKMDNITNDYVVAHNGGEDGIGATLKVEFINCPDGLYVLAGVCGCDRVEDIVAKVDSSFREGDWAHVTFRYDNGLVDLQMMKYTGDILTPTAPLVNVTVNETDALPVEDLKKIFGQLSTRSRDEVDKIKADVEALKVTEPRRIDELTEITDCLDESSSMLDEFDRYLDKKNNNGFEKFKETKKTLRKLKNQCKRTRRGGLPDPAEHQTALDEFVREYNKLKEILGSLCDGHQKICDLTESNAFNSGLQGYRTIKNKIRYLKRKVRKLKESVGVENPPIEGSRGFKWDDWIEKCTKCIETATALGSSGRKRRNIDYQISTRVKRDDDDELRGPNIVKQTKHRLTYGEDLIGSMDRIIMCRFYWPEQDVINLQETGDSIERPPLPNGF
ncbi:unnamed protein product [Owenia fusiformis]|uniref:Uncharacterized protein n=1 Tax=Owenia fusiformis TaxID=6347 RepID=A0A8S4PM40_OWEFU|nr:unnamed protein product [Owenia fusiformis]